MNSVRISAVQSCAMFLLIFSASIAGCEQERSDVTLTDQTQKELAQSSSLASNPETCHIDQISSSETCDVWLITQLQPRKCLKKQFCQDADASSKEVINFTFKPTFPKRSDYESHTKSLRESILSLQNQALAYASIGMAHGADRVKDLIKRTKTELAEKKNELRNFQKLYGNLYVHAHKNSQGRTDGKYTLDYRSPAHHICKQYVDSKIDELSRDARFTSKTETCGKHKCQYNTTFQLKKDGNADTGITVKLKKLEYSHTLPCSSFHQCASTFNNPDKNTAASTKHFIATQLKQLESDAQLQLPFFPKFSHYPYRLKRDEIFPAYLKQPIMSIGPDFGPGLIPRGVDVRFNGYRHSYHIAEIVQCEFDIIATTHRKTDDPVRCAMTESSDDDCLEWATSEEGRDICT